MTVAHRLQDKVAVVTGAASGLGKATAIRFAEEGADIAVADINAARAAETVRAVEALGRRAFYQETDTAQEDACEALAQATVDRFGRLDIVFTAAGLAHAHYVSREGHEEAPIPWPEVWEMGFLVNKPLKDWERVLSVNLTGVMLTSRACARRMIACGNGGSIVHVSSVGATLPFKGIADYAVSKAGVWMLTKVLAQELAQHEIRVNAVGPGFIETPMNAAVRSSEAGANWMLDMMAIRRFGQPADIANAALFLASDESAYVTGEILYVDAGIFTG